MLGRMLSQNMVGQGQEQPQDIDGAGGAMPMMLGQLLQGGQGQGMDMFGQSNNAGLLAALRGLYGR